MTKKTLSLLAVAFVAGILILQCCFTVHQTQKAIILELGKPVGQTLGPGLHFKLPFIQNVLYFDSRILNYDARTAEALTKDKKVIILDNYARWRIVNPLIFYQRLRTIPDAQARLDEIIYSELRVVVGTFDLTEVVSTSRQIIMEKVMDQVEALTKEYGVEIVDVRIKRTDLPVENQRAIFNRMTAERERQAKEYRSEGEKEATIIRSTADRDKVILLADAKRKSSILHGEGDAEATRIFGEAVSRSPEFFEFSRSLEAYRKSLTDNTRLLLNTNDSFLRFINRID